MDCDPAFHEYYEQTLRFVDFSQQHHDWFLRGEHLGIDA